jgi:ATPase subunit of ABC transporter with duplicated ATPase domains
MRLCTIKRKETVLNIQNLVYSHPNKDLLFEGLSLSIGEGEKVALVGANGSGKSTLLKLMAGVLHGADGVIKTESEPWFVPQHYGQFDGLTAAQAIRVSGKLAALSAILSGELEEGAYDALADDWSIEERCAEALSRWGLPDLDLSQPLSSLSGGQKTRLFLAGTLIHRPQLVLLDEPSNHLDAAGRALLRDYVQSTAATLAVVSHDRSLLNLLPAVYELSRRGITAYGGNYDFYAAQKAMHEAALGQALNAKQSALRKAEEVARRSTERQQKLDARGRKKQDKAGVATIMLNTLRNNAEKSTARSRNMHAEKTGAMARDISELRKELPDKDKMKLGFDDSDLHAGKLLIAAKDIQYAWMGNPLWPQPMSFEVRSGARMAIKGDNGSGKTTLIRMLLGSLQPTAGHIVRSVRQPIYIDQDYSIIERGFSVYEQASRFNSAHLEAHEVKSRLTHFLFTKETWDKPCTALSGGERMRLALCCLTLGAEPPDLIILDEPTNNLDLQNVSILTAAIRDYKGTLIVVSHDAVFLEEVGVATAIEL